ncbi:MAG: DEAD/DEAH box helicase family protein [Planctomycetes bacterium]|nr:DEAD/DEAH box helicase family protein [Planctomycetota bacterium]
MSLRDIPLKLSYNSGGDNLIEEFYIPCFKNSVRYERAVGFFTSEILSVISAGLNEFIVNSGIMNLICSPKFSEEDIKAIEKGYEDRNSVIYSALLREINQIPEGIINDNLNFLSWLITVNRLEIKVALPEHISWDNYGIYHEKMGLFYDDEENVVAFSGSNNETLYSVTYNYESFDVYKSWVDKDRCGLKIEHFKELWKDASYGVKIYDFPVAIKKKIIEKVIPQEWPAIKHGSTISKKTSKNVDPKIFLDNLWYFQKEAIDHWRENEFSGILSMATGTGKTKTAIGGLIELQKLKGGILTIVCCPQNTILKQWQNEIDELSIFKDSIVADSTNTNWARQVADKVIDYNEGYINNCVIYTTYNTLSSEKFINIMSKLGKTSLLVCDEVHWAGADTFRQGLLPIFNYRLGLSATPVRYMDEEGTDEIKGYFGKVVYEFSLERALKEVNPETQKTFLSSYQYYPKFVSLNEEELIEYNELTAQIKRQYAKESILDKHSARYQRLCEKRQAVIINAHSKFEMLEQLITLLEPVMYLLIYCSPQQIDIVQELLNQKGIVNHRFTGEEGVCPKKEYIGVSERDYIISKFESSDYKTLVAMRCLDEGVNILRAEVAILMASSGNPKEYIQRRGRLLRRHSAKQSVKIYDLIVMPYSDKCNLKDIGEDELKILKKEFKRYEEFASLADNKLEAMNEVFKIKEAYNIY